MSRKSCSIWSHDAGLSAMVVTWLYTCDKLQQGHAGTLSANVSCHFPSFDIVL